MRKTRDAYRDVAPLERVSHLFKKLGFPLNQR